MNEPMPDGLVPPWWVPDERLRRSLTEELLAELSQGHPLFGQIVEVVNRCGACDEVLVKVGEGDFGMVHLTWSARPESAPWPSYTHGRVRRDGTRTDDP